MFQSLHIFYLANVSMSTLVLKNNKQKQSLIITLFTGFSFSFHKNKEEVDMIIRIMVFLKKDVYRFTKFSRKGG